MSAGILPDVYRYTARKSTVSKTPKPSNLSLCNNSTSQQTTTIHYSSYHNDNTKQPPIFDTIERHIKLEKEIPLQQQVESFIILPENEIEQMVISENNEQINEEIIKDIIETIKNQIVQSSSVTSVSHSNQIIKSFSTDTQDVHDTIGSIMNQINENDNNESSSSIIKQNVNRNLEDVTPMEIDSSQINTSRTRSDDDIVEIREPSTNNDSIHTCTCQCHKSNSPQNNDFLLFEQALKQTRLEQQNEKSLNNNRLIQTLKRQHEELLNIYQQNKSLKQFNFNKIDREQQTTQFHQHDSQVQTDVTPTNNSKVAIAKQQKSIITSTTTTTTSSNTTNNHGPPLATRNNSTNHTVYNSFTSSSASTSSQVVPRASSNVTASATKISAVATKSQSIISNIPVIAPPPPPPPLLSNHIPHDVVDLTEEDEEDTTNRAPAQRITATRQSTSFIQPSILSPALSSSSPTTTPSTPTATATATRIRATTTTTATTTTAPPPPPPTTTTNPTTAATNITPNRNIRPNTSLSNGQSFPLRPLPEHNPCDHTIARPQLNITQENTTVRLTWNLQSTPMESIQNYEIYAYKQNATLTASDWKKIGTVKSMRLPMAVTLKEFQSNSHYAFAVRAVSMNNRIGPFCEPKTIFTGNTPVQPLHTSQLLNVST